MTSAGRGDRARLAMIDTAERLIAERGLGALSLREVAAAAGQRNHSAVQYHFGSRAGLVDAVFDARMTPIDARRSELLALLEQEAATDDLWALTDVFVRPLGEAVLIDRPGWYGRFLSEVIRSEPTLLRAERPAMESLIRSAQLMVDHMDAVPPELRPDRIRMATGAAVAVLADRETQLATAATGDPPPFGSWAPELFVTSLVDLVHAMVSAPPSPRLRDQLAALADPG